MVEKRTTGTGSQTTGLAAKELKSVHLHVGARGRDSIRLSFTLRFEYRGARASSEPGKLLPFSFPQFLTI